MDILDKRTLPDPEKVSNWDLAIRYGTIWAVSGFLMTIIGFLTDTDPGHPNTSSALKILYFLAGIGIAIWAIRAAILADRDGQLGGFISMGRAARIGAKLGLVCGTAGGLLQIVYTQLINPYYTENIIRPMQEQFVQQGMNEDEVEWWIDLFKYFFGPIPSLLVTIMLMLILGTIIGLIAGAVLKKDPY